MLNFYLIVFVGLLIYPNVRTLFIFPERAHSSQYASLNGGVSGMTDAVKDSSIGVPRDRQTHNAIAVNPNIYDVATAQPYNLVAAHDLNQYKSDTLQGRNFFEFNHNKKKKKRRRRKKKRPCIPATHRPPKYGGRTYPNINLVYVEVNENQYNPTGGYYCRPQYGQGQGSHGIHGIHDLFGLTDEDDDDDDDDNDDDHADDQEEYDDVAEDDNYVPINSHGALISSVSNNRPAAVSTGSVSSSPTNGGPLGFFGQGGLFDFTGGGGAGNGAIAINPSRPQVNDPYSDTRPVIEINVPDTVQNVVTWRPGNVVGGIQQAVNGFVQQAVTRPERTFRQINQELYTFFEPIASLLF